METLRVKLGFEGMFVVDPIGRSGGLGLFWKEKDLLEIQNYSRMHINAVVKTVEGTSGWKLTGFYGQPDWTKRHESWALLRHLKQFSPFPWLCIGDYNEITDQSEKVGANLRKNTMMGQFREALEDCNLSDLGYIGSKYTWNNRREDDGFIKERLDRATANTGWCNLFKKFELRVLAARTSDHKPLLLSYTDRGDDCAGPLRGTKFEARWLHDEEANEVIRRAWISDMGGGPSMNTVQQKLATCKADLRTWSWKKHGQVEKKIKEKTKELEEVQKQENKENVGKIQQLQGEIDILLEQEDTRWKQRAKQNWYQQGDRNTPFFHAWASHRRKINYIGKVVDEGGTEWSKMEDIGTAFTEFYQQLFTTGTVQGVGECLEGMERRVTEEMNNNLLRPFTQSEVEDALNQMHPLKSPGPDGMSAVFYQHSWGMINKEVCKAVLDFLNNGIFEPSINETFITLIPKIKTPTRITEYRPISLCNVIYKLIAKALANRMKKVLSQVISPNQSAFLPGRLITDNILVAYEALHTMDARLSGRKGYMALKLDMSKAYDRVEWAFLEAIMVGLGFAEEWVGKVMTCVRTVTYSILINGQPYGKIVPSRGIRQGDPLSPYLFILCAEGLSTLLNKAEQEGQISGFPIARRGTKINHLLFADDSLLFCRASILEWARIQDVLEVYEKASGQQLNRSKTSIFFSKNTKIEAKTVILNAAGVISTDRYEKYLGLPALIGRSKVSAFTNITGKIWERINGWKEKFLSQAGKEVLLKAVVQSIPTFTMSVFQLPKTLCKEINAMMAKFWWGHKENDSRIAWMSWHKMGMAKESGGLGFRDLEMFNLALLAKQGWRIMTNPNTLVATILREKYYPHGNFLEANLGRKPSYAWRSIWNAKGLLNEGLIWRVGNGESIRIWEDRWLPNKGSHKVQSPIHILPRDATVSALLNSDTRWWDTDLVHNVFNEEEAREICGMVVCPNTRSDRLVWAGEKNGVFTVRSAYHLAKALGLREEGSCSEDTRLKRVWKGIWKIRGASVVKTFMWQACNNILPTKEVLHKRKITQDPLCPIYGLKTETVGHILWSCPSARDVWTECYPKLSKCASLEADFIDIMAHLLERLDADQLQFMASVARQIWLRRNLVVFGGELTEPSTIIRWSKDQVENWCNFNKRRTRREVTSERAPSTVWTKPPQGYVKINWDASVDKQRNRMGVGVVIRDHEGGVVAMFCTSKEFVQDPTMAEAIGAWEAVKLAQRLELRQALFEGDSLEVVRMMQREDGCWTTYGQIVNDAQERLQHLNGWGINHVGRSANGAAHQLAKLALGYVDTREWQELFPPSVLSIVLAES
ncbi:uncharacterized protein LOC132187853 [Corylus avellana]|uniref:uncharacterized protein LOC132187853 n=1 Tax=Corylus avellana TaxID=13451 RepID=UPI00286B10FD|nr:uncharacterized protein LOC132187853 [Corylus avellana]